MNTSGAVATVFVVGLVVVAGWVFYTRFVPSQGGGLFGGSGGSSGATLTTPPPSGVSALLVDGPVVATTPSTFWAISAHAGCGTCITSNPGVGQFLNQTPITWFRYGAGEDACNVSANIQYTGNGVANGPCASSISSFKVWCYSLTPHCHSILTIPGENNLTWVATQTVNYVENTVGFHPDLWAVGNEPAAYTHYGKAWTAWRTGDSAGGSPIDYAVEVRNYIAAARAVDATTQFVGIEAACSCNHLWIQDVAKVDGSLITWMAYHSYPGGRGTVGETLTNFYNILTSATNISQTLASVKADVLTGCPSCTSFQYSIGEYNAGLSGPNWSAFLTGYADAAFFAASLVQALVANVSDWTYFTLTGDPFSMFNASNNSMTQTGLLYTKVFTKTILGRVHQTSVQTTVPGVFSVAVSNGTREWVLVVNTNLTQTLNLATTGLLQSGTQGFVATWYPNGISPSDTNPASLPGTFLVPPQGILMFGNYGA